MHLHLSHLLFVSMGNILDFICISYGTDLSSRAYKYIYTSLYTYVIFRFNLFILQEFLEFPTVLLFLVH